MDRDDAILDYLQGRLPPAERERFEASMAGDPALAAEVAVMRAARDGLADAPRHDRADAVWDRLSAAIDAPPVAANQNRPLWRQFARYAAVAALAVVSWQVAIAPLITDAPPVYRAASDGGDGFVLQVRFADGATMAEITALLSQFDGAIVGGPGALGLLRVSFADEAARARALEGLTAQSALVDFAQTP
jgi:anti-sigma-K factor RskA